jgi:nitroimidazol reductase NimA-like FMN-containing flavoprotein (pyridoxamine 5'-phosphate oxidase superfamily)
MTTDRSGKLEHIKVLPEDECRALLETTTVGRVAFVNDEGQQLVPVNFAFIDGTIFFRTLGDGFLAQLARDHDDVAFGVDHHAETYRNGWNVTVKGSASEVEDRATINKVLAHSSLRPWAGGVRPLVIRITVDSIAGRRVVGH